MSTVGRENCNNLPYNVLTDYSLNCISYLPCMFLVISLNTLENSAQIISHDNLIIKYRRLLKPTTNLIILTLSLHYKKDIKRVFKWESKKSISRNKSSFANYVIIVIISYQGAHALYGSLFLTIIREKSE